MEIMCPYTKVKIAMTKADGLLDHLKRLNTLAEVEDWDEQKRNEATSRLIEQWKYAQDEKHRKNL